MSLFEAGWCCPVYINIFLHNIHFSTVFSMSLHYNIYLNINRYFDGRNFGYNYNIQKEYQYMQTQFTYNIIIYRILYWSLASYLFLDNDMIHHRLSQYTYYLLWHFSFQYFTVNIFYIFNHFYQLIILNKDFKFSYQNDKSCTYIRIYMGLGRYIKSNNNCTWLEPNFGTYWIHNMKSCCIFNKCNNNYKNVMHDNAKQIYKSLLSR